jgi:hypothetical protein
MSVSTTFRGRPLFTVSPATAFLAAATSFFLAPAVVSFRGFGCAKGLACGREPGKTGTRGAGASSAADAGYAVWGTGAEEEGVATVGVALSGAAVVATEGGGGGGFPVLEPIICDIARAVPLAKPGVGKAGVFFGGKVREMVGVIGVVEGLLERKASKSTLGWYALRLRGTASETGAGAALVTAKLNPCTLIVVGWAPPASDAPL